MSEKMSEVDDLQSFIADCEWKTRKILRESNKRTKDNARSLAAKERVERLKHNGTCGKPTLKIKPHPPLTKSKHLNLSVTPASNTNLSITKKTIATPTKEWKRRDKIIHDAYETIKSFPTEKKLDDVVAVRKESQQAEKVKVGIHSSLSASPFCTLKGRPDNLIKPKQKASGTGSNLGFETNGNLGNDEPAMVTRRTIERDFYIMSKKRNNPPSKRRQSSKKGERSPELKMSVLRKKYRCDERIMKAKRKRGERLYEKLKRLKIPNEEGDGMAGTVGGDEGEDSESSVSSDEEEYIHAIHELVERHITDENNRSLKRSNKALMNSAFKPDVKEFWDHLQQNNESKESTESPGNDEILCRDGQVPSVSLHIAAKKFDARAREISCTEEITSQSSIVECLPKIGYLSPYQMSKYRKLHLVVNEPLTAPTIDRTIPLAITIAWIRIYPTGLELLEPNAWIYEIYDPCNGSARTFMFSDEEFHSMHIALKHSASPVLTHQPGRKLIEKVVYHEAGSCDGVDCTFVVLMSVNGSRITSKLYQSNGLIVDKPDSLCVEEHLIANLRTCEVLHLLKKHHIYCAFDTEFWLDEYNCKTIWKPLVEIFRENSAASNDTSSLMTAVIRAHDSFLSLRTHLNGATSDETKKILDRFQQESSITYDLTNEGDQDAPLSMRISGCSPYSNIICPGQASIGKRGVWRLSDKPVNENTDSMFPIWPSLIDIKNPKSLDVSQASAFFHYKNLGPQKGHCINVLSSLAFESPVLAPYCFATDKGYISPPFSEHNSLTGIIPHVHLPCTSLLGNPVESRLDTLLPPPVVVLDPGASDNDWKNAPRNADGKAYHCRELSELDKDGFRVRTFASRVEYDDTISSMVYGISETAASPNTPTTSPFLTHTSSETCTASLSRERTATDYHYIAESDGKGTLSEPYLFSTHMSAYKSIFISRKSASSYREQERFLHAAKEAEQKKLELALKMKAAEELVEERLRERIAKIEFSVAGKGSSTSNCDTASVAVELPSSVGKADLTMQDDRIPCDVELLIPLTERRDVGESDELNQLANLMLKNANFLKALAQKMGISEQKVLQFDSTTGDDNSVDLNPSQLSNTIETIATDVQHDHGKTSDGIAAEPTLRHLRPDATATLFQAKTMPTLKINCKRYRDNDRTFSRGDGWKRLPRSETIIGDFSLTKRNVERGSGVPKFKKLEETRNFIAVNAVEELLFKADSQQFVTEPKSLFIPDLTTERLQLAKTFRQQEKAKESMLSSSQQSSLDEILQIPVSKKSDKSAKETGAHLGAQSDDRDEVVLEKEPGPIDHVSRAVLAVKNHNLPDLEQVLDTEGLSVETRDQHGNTLFILACQQGSKKLAKFLLRRGADINAQNNGGNAALHYLYEYKQISLAEYLIRKGANDSIKNGEGLTVYEGTQLN